MSRDIAISREPQVIEEAWSHIFRLSGEWPYISVIIGHYYLLLFCFCKTKYKFALSNGTVAENFLFKLPFFSSIDQSPKKLIESNFHFSTVTWERQSSKYFRSVDWVLINTYHLSHKFVAMVTCYAWEIWSLFGAPYIQ